MEIRDDFKVDFDSWKKEAKLLCRKAVLFIFIFSFIIPFGTYCLMDKFESVTPSLNMIHYPISAIALVFFSMFTAFYVLFYFKRIDFGEPKNILNVFRDVLSTYRNFIEYSKLHLVFVYVFVALTLILMIIGFFVSIPYEPRSYLRTLSSSLTGVYISFFLLIAATHKYIFGLVYIAYGMVNKEGAQILTINAYNKYPELMNYVSRNASLFNSVYIFGWLVMMVSLNDIVRIVMSTLFIVWSCYHVAIYYLISRDLYGGKKQTQKVTEKVEDLNAMPDAI